MIILVTIREQNRYEIVSYVVLKEKLTKKAFAGLVCIVAGTMVMLL